MTQTMTQSVFAPDRPATTDVALRKAYHYRHIVSFEETNLVGNVYYVRHLSWQGRCREMFLRDHASSVLEELGRDLRLVTLRVECEYFEEFRAFDTVELQMKLAQQSQNRIALEFDYILERSSEVRSVAARGKQEVACMRETPAGLEPTQVPDDLKSALRAYA